MAWGYDTAQMDSSANRCQQYGPLLVKAFVAAKLPAAWGLAIARQESNFYPEAVSMAKGDAGRGGSYGLCQMSLLTAREYMPTITGSELLKAEANAHLAARHCAALVKRFGENLRDVAAAYNSGHPYATCPNSTRNVYVPNVLSYEQLYREQAAAMEAGL